MLRGQGTVSTGGMRNYNPTGAEETPHYPANEIEPQILAANPARG